MSCVKKAEKYILNCTIPGDKMKLIITFVQRLPEKNQQNLPHDQSKALTKPQSPPLPTYCGVNQILAEQSLSLKPIKNQSF